MKALFNVSETTGDSSLRVELAIFCLLKWYLLADLLQVLFQSAEDEHCACINFSGFCPAVPGTLMNAFQQNLLFDEHQSRGVIWIVSGLFQNFYTLFDIWRVYLKEFNLSAQRSAPVMGRCW